jgi:hypothetical protein
MGASHAHRGRFPGKGEYLRIDSSQCGCLGIGSKLRSSKLIASHQYSTLTTNVQQVLAWIKETREGVSVI